MVEESDMLEEESAWKVEKGEIWDSFPCTVYG